MKFLMISSLMTFYATTSFLTSTAHGGTSYFGGSNNQGYLDWLTSVSFNQSTFIASDSNPDQGVAVHWNIDNDNTTIQLAIVAPATGWSAFGLAESGSMRGADIVMYTASTNTLTDSFVLDQLVMPIPDACPSHWTLIDSTITDDGFIIFMAQRLLNTGDTQDRAIIDDSSTIVAASRVIAAWGDSDTPSFHGSNSARGSIRFFGTSETIDIQTYFAQSMAKEAEGNFTVSAQDFTIPAIETTYQLFCFSLEDLIDRGVPMNDDLHTIGFEPIVQSGNSKYVHHYVLYGSSDPWNKTLPCTNENYPQIETAYGWAPGAFPQILPSNVGGLLGRDGFQSFALETHYNNVDFDANISDSSGVRIYYTSKKREFDLGSFSFGDPNVVLYGAPVTSTGGLTQHTFTCEEQCLSTYLTEPVTVIQENLHMHMTGVSVVNVHIRNGKVIRLGKVDFWDFDQQGDLVVVQPPYQLLPGDSFRTICNYNSANPVFWGPASSDEMCMATLSYYPRKLAYDMVPLTCGLGVGEFLPGCEAIYNLTLDLTSLEQLKRTFGSAPLSCLSSVSPPTSSPFASPLASPVPTSFAEAIPSYAALNTFVGALVWATMNHITY